MFVRVKDAAKRCHELLIARIIWQDGVRSGEAAPNVAFARVVDWMFKAQQFVAMRKKLIYPFVALADSAAKTDKVRTILREHCSAVLIDRAGWVALIPDQQHLSARLEDAAAFQAERFWVEPMESLRGRDKVHALVWQRGIAVAAGDGMKPRKSSQQTFGLGAHVWVGFHREDFRPEQQQLAREDAGSRAYIGNGRARADSKLSWR